MSDTWFYTLDQRNRIGPMSLTLMQMFVQWGMIQPTTYVLQPGQKRWERASRVPELFPIADALPVDEPAPAPASSASSPTRAAAPATRLTGTWAGSVLNDSGETESQAFVFSVAGNPVHASQGRDGRPVFVEVTQVGQVITHAGPRRAGRLTVQELKVTPTAVSWSAQDAWLRSGGQATPGSFVTDVSGNDLITWEASLRGEELDVQTVCRMHTSSTDNIRDFGLVSGTFGFDNSAVIWKRGALRKISDDPNHLLRRFGG
jgi:hypothetical protein